MISRKTAQLFSRQLFPAIAVVVEFLNSRSSLNSYTFYIALCTCAMLCTYIYIGKQCTGTLRARMCALPLLHTYIYIIDLCRSESYSGTHMYIYIQYISKMKKKKNKLRYFDHTCRSGILYTVMCITFLSRAKVCRSSAFV